MNTMHWNASEWQSWIKMQSKTWLRTKDFIHQLLKTFLVLFSLQTPFWTPIFSILPFLSRQTRAPVRPQVPHRVQSLLLLRIESRRSLRNDLGVRRCKDQPGSLTPLSRFEKSAPLGRWRWPACFAQYTPQSCWCLSPAQGTHIYLASNLPIQMEIYLAKRWK